MHVMLEAGGTQNVLPTIVEKDLEIVEACWLTSGDEVQLDAVYVGLGDSRLRWSRSVGRVTPFVEADVRVSSRHVRPTDAGRKRPEKRDVRASIFCVRPRRHSRPAVHIGPVL